MEAFEPKSVYSILDIIGIDSLRLGGLQINCNNIKVPLTYEVGLIIKNHKNKTIEINRDLQSKGA